MCVRKACCPGLSESLFFFPFLTSHNPCFFPSLCRALPYIHMGPAILQAVAGQERTSIERYLLSFLVPCCRHLLCKLAKKRSGLSLVLHTNDSSTFIISSLWMAHISILHHFKNQSTLSPTPPVGYQKPIQHLPPFLLASLESTRTSERKSTSSSTDQKKITLSKRVQNH